MGRVYLTFIMLLLILGLLSPWLHRLGLIGRLPGDIRLGKDSPFYLPLSTSLILSVILSLILAIVRSA